MNRRNFLSLCGTAALTGLFPSSALAQQKRKPNILLILCDDLGFAELGSYGQTKIRTPHIDRLAAEGLRFTQFYSGSPVCAPARCTLLTGKHTGHCSIRDNEEVKPEGQRPLPENTPALATFLKEAGYATACIGKWGLGGPGSTGEPLKHGFDHFFGHLCQRVAHNHYSTHLWRDTEKVVLTGNKEGNPTGAQYAPDLMADDALAFIRKNAAQPFFLYFATPLPHLALQAPEEAIKPYLNQFDEKPYDGKKNYLPTPIPRATYAAMVTRIDEYVGRMMNLLKELNIDNDTIVLFASDNGATFQVGGADSAFFQSSANLRGLKQDVYEGGIRAPLIVRWPNVTPAGKTTDQIAALWDLFPTLLEAAGAKVPIDIDGLSLLPTLTAQGTQEQHDHLYWEYHAQGGRQAVRQGDWKALRNQVTARPNAPVELYNLKDDPAEKTNVAAQHPDIAQRLTQLMRDSRTPSDNPKWNFQLPPTTRKNP